MGALYTIKCEQCGSEFEHSVGVGFAYACVGCGEVTDESAPFWCPVCNKRYNPREENFADKLQGVVLWD